MTTAARVPRAWLVAAIAATLPAAAALPVDPAVLEAERGRVEAIRRASAAAVSIFAGDASGGSGVVLSPDGHAATNFHVVQPIGPALTCGLADGSLHDAVLVGVDPTGDLAIIKLLGRDDFPWVQLADSDAVAVGDFCFAAGNPLLLATDLVPTVTAGIVSGVHRYQFPAGTILEYTDCLQVDLSINPGNSGGGLFDAAARLVGVNGRASFEKRGRVNVGAAYAISSNQLRNFMGSLRAGRICDHATLGATVSTSADGRVVVTDILASSDAWRRGLRHDDEIVMLAGRPVRSVNEFKNLLGTLPAGWQVPLGWRRDGERQEMLVRLAAVHSPAELAALARGDTASSGDDGRDEQPQLPAAVRALYDPRPGHANHHFATVERDRVAATLASFRDAVPPGPWVFTGTLGDGGEFRIELSDAGASIDLPTGTSTLDAAADFERAAVPPGSGGMLPALVLWRRLVVEGPAAVGRTEYWGTAARDPATLRAGATAELADVLETAVAGVEARFTIDASGRATVIDLWTDPDADPCELRLVWPAPSDGAAAPATIEARRRGEPFATFHLEALPAGAAP